MKKKIYLVFILIISLFVALWVIKSVEFYPENDTVTCLDGVDNDLDGKADCEDEGCQHLEECL